MLITKPYNRARAVEYARTWALRRNPLFADFSDIGGNCTNFVSQCILAGSCVMNYTPDFGWYYVSLNDRAPAWSGVEFFYDFLTGKEEFAAANGGIGPFAVEVPLELAEEGDALQYADARGDWYHTVLVTGRRDGELLVSAQSNDALDRPISTYTFERVRCLHLEGVRIAVEDERCYRLLLSGGFAQEGEETP